ncbi:MAG: HupE/UreJ family protein [Asticcacaulis sp.]|uniref:HupE/UreJ family protein n=1 Tax=Asticcacaulis sp. TaxID=1872648 RepID=UPI0039E2BE98
MRYLAVLLALVTTLSSLISAKPAHAHPMPQSFVEVREVPSAWTLSLRLPADRLSAAFIQAGLVPDPGPNFTVYPTLRPEQVKAYVQDHIVARSAANQPWSEQVTVVRGPTPKVDEWQVNVRLTPPAGIAASNGFSLDYEVIGREIATHSAVVSVVEDWSGGMVAQHTRILGTVGGEKLTVQIVPQHGQIWKAFVSMVRLGAQHIAEGTDHLLFLLALLLPAPLLVAGKKWGEYGGASYTFKRLLKVVTAFTLGHSATLILGAFGGLTVPQKPVEVLIAVSIFFSALHAWRPMFRGKEPWIAAGFGLIHGMSFATVISSVGLDVWQKVTAVFGFNLGIELMQLLIVALVVPWLILLARARAYRRVRLTGAVLAAVSSVAWAIARINGYANPVSELMDAMLAHAAWGLIPLAIAAVVLFLVKRRPQGAETSPAE